MTIDEAIQGLLKKFDAVEIEFHACHGDECPYQLQIEVSDDEAENIYCVTVTGQDMDELHSKIESYLKELEYHR